MRNKIGIALQLIGLAVACFPVYIWVRHPELTEMQVFLSYWWLYLIAFGLAGAGTLIKQRR